ncbi:hypothetical protein DL96DRAFT_1616024 [Flagelloscypha sp. PMI_526]|nr:hypothetical protein DL96DRAFT_1616024 [Flagelloscypha sp. PMI_526]
MLPQMKRNHEILLSTRTLRELSEEHRNLSAGHDKLLMDPNNTWYTSDSLATKGAKVHCEMEKTAKRLAILKVGREKRSRRLEACMVALSPVRSLPSEIVAEIFLAEVGQEPRMQDVIRLLHISRCWREIGKAACRLWTFISLSPSPKHKEDYPFLNLLEEWLLRSGDLPLRIHLNLAAMDRQLATKLLGICLRFSARWETVHLTMPEWDDMAVFLSIAEPESLKKISILTLHNSFGRNSTPLAWEVAPALSILRLDLRACYPLPTMLFPWHQLTQLDLLVSTDIRQCLQFMRLSTSLGRSKLDFQSVPHQGSIVDPFPSVRLPTIQSLEIISGAILHRVLNCMTLPSLSQLGLRLHNKLHLPIDAFQDFLARSGCILTKLSLHFVRLSLPGFAAVLPYMPELIELLVEGWHLACFSRQILLLLDPASALALSYSPPLVLLPKLEFLHVDCRDLRGVDLVGFIQTRWYDKRRNKFGLRQLKSVKVSAKEPLCRDSAKQVMNFVEEGLKVVVKTTQKAGILV